MNAPESFFLARRLELPDTQALRDERRIAIQRVGVRGLRYPIEVAGADGRAQPTVAELAMYVGLPHDVKGTHMSRFVEVIEARRGALDLGGARALERAMRERQGADTGFLQIRFPYFVRKRAPVSGVESLLDYQACWTVETDASGATSTTVEIVAPVTSLCPCSKKISDYGAHNQRSHITIRAKVVGDVTLEELARVAEDEASCEVWGLLKRPDEKWVTERAYDNPKFVEDLVRDIALRLERHPRVAEWFVASENFESIHNHSAHAELWGRGAAIAG